MKAHLIDTHLLVSRSSAKVKVKYQGHVSQKMGVSGALVFHKHILFGKCFALLLNIYSQTSVARTWELSNTRISVPAKFVHSLMCSTSEKSYTPKVKLSNTCCGPKIQITVHFTWKTSNKGLVYNKLTSAADFHTHGL